MRLGPAETASRFAAMTPEEKAAVVQTHARVWLERNRSRLTARQVAVVQEAIDFVTPELYRSPDIAQQVKREEELRAKLRCQVPRSDVMAAFGVLRPRTAESSWFDDLWAWFEDCVIGWVPPLA